MRFPSEHYSTVLMYHILSVLHLSMEATWVASTVKFFTRFVNYLHRSEVKSVTKIYSKKSVFCLILFIPIFSFLKEIFLIKWFILPFFLNPKKTFFPIQKIKFICVSPFLENGSILYYFSVSWLYHLMTNIESFSSFFFLIIYTTVCTTSFLLMDIWVVCSFLLFKIVLQNQCTA